MSLGIRSLQREVFQTNPAIDHPALRRAFATPDADTVPRHAALVQLLSARRRRPGPLPADWQAGYDESLNRAVARLVLDDVLRVRWRSAFVGGARAYRRVFRSNGTDVETPSPVTTRYSLDVLEAAASLPTDTPEALTLCLYFGHRAPVTPATRQRFPSPRQSLRALLEGADSTARRLLETRWRMSSPAARGQVWLSWSNRRRLPREDGALTYKLYISAAMHHLGEAFRGALPVFASHDVSTFKIGCDAYHLVRPDKFVAYFDSRDQLDQAAIALRAALGGLAGHGVPFCAPAAGDRSGLLSWGVDFAAGVSNGDERTSWRWWLCERLGRFMATVKRAPHHPRNVHPVRFALDRLGLDGIDVATFTPTETFLVEAARPVAGARAV